MQFLEAAVRERPDILALQEANQSLGAPLAKRADLAGMFGFEGREPMIRSDNHALRVAQGLHGAGIPCSWRWQPVKVGYGKYDEGLALFCLNQEITEADSFFISGCTAYENWKTRRALGIRTDKSGDWFYTVHMGWWQDEEEPFLNQWKRMQRQLARKKAEARIWLMGDFNCPSGLRGQGYDCVRESGWQDTYELAAQKDSGVTVEGAIDGWEDRDESQASSQGMRIDYIWCSKKSQIRSSNIIFNGLNGPKVSDHFGVLVMTAD